MERVHNFDRVSRSIRALAGGPIVALTDEVERLGESQVRDCVKGEKVEPVSDVDVLPQARVHRGDKVAEHLVDDLFHREDLLLAENVTHDPSFARVLRPICGIGNVVIRTSDVVIVFGLHYGRPVTVDVFQGLRVSERDMVWHDTHDRSMLVVSMAYSEISRVRPVISECPKVGYAS